MEPIEIRGATAKDADAVADYHDRCFKDTYAAQLQAGEFAAPDPEGTRQQLQEHGISYDEHVLIKHGTATL